MKFSLAKALMAAVASAAAVCSEQQHQLSFEHRHSKLLVHVSISFLYEDASIEEAAKRFATTANWTLVVLDMDDSVGARAVAPWKQSRLERELRLSWKENYENATLVGSARKSIIFPLEPPIAGSTKLYRVLDVRIEERTATKTVLLGRTLTQLPRSSLVVYSGTTTEIRFADLTTHLPSRPPPLYHVCLHFIWKKRILLLQGSILFVLSAVAVYHATRRQAPNARDPKRVKPIRVVTFDSHVQFFEPEEEDGSRSSSDRSSSEATTILASDESDGDLPSASNSLQWWSPEATQNVFATPDIKPSVLPVRGSFRDLEADDDEMTLVDNLATSLRRTSLQPATEASEVNKQLENDMEVFEMTAPDPVYSPNVAKLSQRARDSFGAPTTSDPTHVGKSPDDGKSVLPPVENRVTLPSPVASAPLFGSPMPGAPAPDTVGTPDLSVESFIHDMALQLVDGAVDESEAKARAKAKNGEGVVATTKDPVDYDSVPPTLLQSDTSNSLKVESRNNDLVLIASPLLDKQDVRSSMSDVEQTVHSPTLYVEPTLPNKPVSAEKVQDPSSSVDQTQLVHREKRLRSGAPVFKEPIAQPSAKDEPLEAPAVKRRKKSLGYSRKQKHAVLYAQDDSWDVDLTGDDAASVVASKDATGKTARRNDVKRPSLARLSSISNTVVKKEPLESPPKTHGSTMFQDWNPEQGKRNSRGQFGSGKKSHKTM